MRQFVQTSSYSASGFSSDFPEPSTKKVPNFFCCDSLATILLPAVLAFRWTCASYGTLIPFHAASWNATITMGLQQLCLQFHSLLEIVWYIHNRLIYRNWSLWCPLFWTGQILSFQMPSTLCFLVGWLGFGWSWVFLVFESKLLQLWWHSKQKSGKAHFAYM